MSIAANVKAADDYPARRIVFIVPTDRVRVALATYEAGTLELAARGGLSFKSHY